MSLNSDSLIKTFSTLDLTQDVENYYKTFNEIAPQLLKETINEEFRHLCSSNGVTLKVLQIVQKCISKIQCYAKEVQFEVDDYTHYNVQVDEILLETITNGCRLLRNLCANCIENRQILNDSSLIYDLLPLFTNIQLWGLGEFSWSTKYELFIQISIQMISNYSIQNEKGQTLIWKYYFPGVFLKVYKHYKHNRKILSYTSALMYKLEFIFYKNSLNCLSDPQNESIDLNKPIDTQNNIYLRVYSLSKEIELLNRILSSLLLSDSHETIEDTTLYGTSIIHKLLQYITINDVYNSFFSQKYSILSPSQLLLLQIFHEFTLDQPNYPFKLQNYYFICSLLPQLLYTLHLPSDLYNPTHIYVYNIQKENEEIQEKLAKEALSLVFDIISNYPNTYSEELRQHLYDEDIHNIVISILKVPPPLSSKTIEEAAKEGITISPPPEFSLSWPPTLRTAAMKILCNLSYQNKYVQDLVRTSDCLIPILGNTKIDKQNPTLREWSLFTIRNLCENNEENQKAIAEIRFQRVQVQEPLQKLHHK